MDEKASKGRTQSVPRAPMARYANYFEVGHNLHEFLVDFGQFQPEVGAVILHTRIALGPIHAKMLSQIFYNSVQQYETENGEIIHQVSTLDPAQVILRSLPDFERRALSARRQSQQNPSLNPSKRSNPKR